MEPPDCIEAYIWLPEEQLWTSNKDQVCSGLLPVSVHIVRAGKKSHRLAPCTSPFIHYCHHSSYLAILFARMLILISTSWLSLTTIDLNWLVEGTRSCKDSRYYRGNFEGIHLDLSSNYFLWPRRRILLNSQRDFLWSWSRQDQTCSFTRSTIVRRLYLFLVEDETGFYSPPLRKRISVFEGRDYPALFAVLILSKTCNEFPFLQVTQIYLSFLHNFTLYFWQTWN